MTSTVFYFCMLIVKHRPWLTNYIFAVSVEQRQKWDQEIIGLYATVKDDTRSFTILIQNERIYINASSTMTSTVFSWFLHAHRETSVLTNELHIRGVGGAETEVGPGNHRSVFDGEGRHTIFQYPHSKRTMRQSSGHDPWGPRRWRLPGQRENVLCGQIEPATASPISLLQQVVWTAGLCLCSKVSEGGSRLDTHRKDMEREQKYPSALAFFISSCK